MCLGSEQISMLFCIAVAFQLLRAAAEPNIVGMVAASLQSIMCCADDAAKDSGVKEGKPPLNAAFASLLLVVACNLHPPVFFSLCAIFHMQLVTTTLCLH